jgi:hypothetical protein
MRVFVPLNVFERLLDIWFQFHLKQTQLEEYASKLSLYHKFIIDTQRQI